MYLKIRSRNQTANGLKDKIYCPIRTVLRLGSQTPIERIFPRGIKLGKAIKEINTVEACKISGDKILMRNAFILNGVKCAVGTELNNIEDNLHWELFIDNCGNEAKPYPAIIKHIHSSKGQGIYYIQNAEELNNFIQTHNNLDKYIIEKYYTYSKEYRLHVTKDGCFYACRKMLKSDAEVRWHRHDNNSVWILEDNELFDKPNNWDEIVLECVKAMEAVGLDICAIDLKVQTKKDNPEFIILETNSAPSLGEITTIKYVEQLTKMCNAN